MLITTRPEPDSSEFSQILKLFLAQKQHPPSPALPPITSSTHDDAQTAGQALQPRDGFNSDVPGAVEPKASSESAGSLYAAESGSQQRSYQNFAILSANVSASSIAYGTNTMRGFLRHLDTIRRQNTNRLRNIIRLFEPLRIMVSLGLCCR
jgi:hypothetical protein